MVGSGCCEGPILCLHGAMISCMIGMQLKSHKEVGFSLEVAKAMLGWPRISMSLDCSGCKDLPERLGPKNENSKAVWKMLSAAPHAGKNCASGLVATLSFKSVNIALPGPKYTASNFHLTCKHISPRPCLHLQKTECAPPQTHCLAPAL